MENNLYHITLLDLTWALIPPLIVLAIYWRWAGDKTTIGIALIRMLIQLILIGYVLVYIFESESPYLVTGVLSIMLIAASIISLRPIKHRTPKLYLHALISILIAGIFTLFVITQGVMGLNPWFEPHVIIPLAGMIFANAMNAVSLAAERFAKERTQKPYIEARSEALQAALIPVINTLFAVGIVSLPGMMTGQILSGVSPLIAARYQIMVMLMILGAAGIAVAVYLWLQRESDETTK